MVSPKIALIVLLAPCALAWNGLDDKHDPASQAGNEKGDAAATEPSVTVGERSLKLSGPYRHRNLSVYLLHGGDEDDRNYLTLFEGIDKKLVKVAEKKDKQVNELRIDNDSEQYVFLQEGDRVYGGEQDRIIISSLVVPPMSKGVPIPTNCVEQGRWAPRAGAPPRVGDVAIFGNGATMQFAPKGVRAAAKTIPASDGQQAVVWQSVSATKFQAAMILSTDNTNSSLNETLDAPQVKKLIEEHTTVLNEALRHQKDVVGVAIVMNGKLEEVNVYPNRRLLAKLYPRLIQSYAFESTLSTEKPENACRSAFDVVKQMQLPPAEAAASDPRLEQVNPGNVLCVFERDGRFNCTTRFGGRVVHHQFLNGNGANSAMAQAASPINALRNVQPPPSRWERENDPTINLPPVPQNQAPGGTYPNATPFNNPPPLPGAPNPNDR